ncbi:MAG: hypothetical protein SVY53_02865 [Chloroflexota bacterium]|nr:hypothetical protein [Chloroflexota bacterium]
MDRNKRYSFTMLSVIMLSFIVSLFDSSVPNPLSSEESRQYAIDLLSSLEGPSIVSSEEEAVDIVRRAYAQAMEVYENDPWSGSGLTDGLLDKLVEMSGVDIVIIYNSGGWGRVPELDDEEWGEVVASTAGVLEDLGYSTKRIPYGRTENSVSGYYGETKAVLDEMPAKARQLAAEVQLLTQNNPHTRVIITGLSQGAAYTNKVMTLLKSNEQVYGIEAGCPFYCSPLQSERTLIIEDNGVEGDAFADGDAMVLLGCLFDAHLNWALDGFAGGPMKLGGYFDPPGHSYEWHYPGVGQRITEFLIDHFEPKNS